MVRLKKTYFQMLGDTKRLFQHPSKCEKMKKANFNQCLECVAPNCQSKYKTVVYSNNLTENISKLLASCKIEKVLFLWLIYS